jgi:hypothetical protein
MKQIYESVVKALEQAASRTFRNKDGLWSRFEPMAAQIWESNSLSWFIAKGFEIDPTNP